MMVNFSETDMDKSLQTLVARVFGPELVFSIQELNPNIKKPVSEYDFVTLDIIKHTGEMKLGQEHVLVEDTLGGYQHKGHKVSSQVMNRP